ncbi:Bifunctional protein: zinc-containing alcohol dehydrogenase [Labilithrix luteola]|uniref:Bifunctional protein: zinc-containing alcohol dehydrogenase n=1 Tax=Labilithrix luteola TaxID=1391654 RepID=A0A0K1PY14_9BACT|nr:NADP-dependent oxidoreductase [Labilithrix luteola]AKU98039.1 Bifunctional protein: zinc-containing alcohol dehydrogenase [Labilithrix luteola]
MKAVRVHQFGGIDRMAIEETAREQPGEGEVLVRVGAAGVGPWDAWVRAGQSALQQKLPLTLGSDIAGVVENVGPGVTGIAVGDAVYGVTNAEFTGGYSEYAVAKASMIAKKPAKATDVDAASIPVVATTAWEMLFDHAKVTSGQRVLVHGAAGNVGAFALQLAKRAGATVIATAFASDVDFVRSLGADEIIDVQSTNFEDRVKAVDVVIDTVGGETLARSFSVLAHGGVLVSSAAKPDEKRAAECGVKGIYFIVDVNTRVLRELAKLVDEGKLTLNVGDVLPLAEARLAHEMLAGKPHKRGKIVLTVG